MERGTVLDSLDRARLFQVSPPNSQHLISMTQQLPDHSTAQPISTVTKHIKIYSDNPIHDCIDRIINSCACFDEDDDRFGMASVEMIEAAEELIALTVKRRSEAVNKLLGKIYDKKPN
jgi:hypothetical protein